MSMTTAPDITVTITVPNGGGNTTTTSSSSNPPPPLVRTERRISPGWTVEQLKSKLEPITGIPLSFQTIRHRQHHHHQQTTVTDTVILLAPDTALVGDPHFAIRKGVELEVHDGRPAGARQNFSDLSAVEKYEMPVEQYEKLDDSVLAWKRRQGLGRFDPSLTLSSSAAVAASGDTSSHQYQSAQDRRVDERTKADWRTVADGQIQVGRRCRVGREDERRGTVRFVGEVVGLGGPREKGLVWVGIELDEPVGRNDGSVKVEGPDGKTEVKRIFDCQGDKFGVLVRPDKVEVGDWPPLDDLNDDDNDDDDMEEI